MRPTVRQCGAQIHSSGRTVRVGAFTVVRGCVVRPTAIGMSGRVQRDVRAVRAALTSVFSVRFNLGVASSFYITSIMRCTVASPAAWTGAPIPAGSSRRRSLARMGSLLAVKQRPHSSMSARPAPSLPRPVRRRPCLRLRQWKRGTKLFRPRGYDGANKAAERGDDALSVAFLQNITSNFDATHTNYMIRTGRSTYNLYNTH